MENGVSADPQSNRLKADLALVFCSLLWGATFVVDCIRAYTSGSAYAQFEEGKNGELKVGEYAHFIVLSDDLTKIPPAQYTKVRVLQTVAGGRTVYEAH